MAFIRPVSIYSDNGRKVATAQTGSLKTAGNGELEVVDGGVVIARATGAIINSFSCDVIFLFEGNTETQKWAEALESGLPQKIQFSNIDGKKEQGTYFVTGRDVQWDHKNGTMRGSFSFEGGANKRV
jgi:hypothetical protein